MAKVVPNPKGIAELARSEGVKAELERRMEAALAQAKANAPVLTGTYRDSLHIETEETADGVQVRMGSDVEYAMVIEARTGNVNRSLDAAGGQR